MRAARDELTTAKAVAESAVTVLAERERDVRTSVDRKLAALGVDGATIKEFQVLSRQTALRESYKAILAQARDKFAAAERSFTTLLAERKNLVELQRAAFDRVVDAIRGEFGGRISAHRVDDGNRGPLESFLKGLNQRGVTRWWNDLADQKRPSPQELLDKLNAGELARIGMSTAVQSTFLGCLGWLKQRALAAVRCRDRYVLELELVVRHVIIFG